MARTRGILGSRDFLSDVVGAGPSLPQDQVVRGHGKSIERRQMVSPIGRYTPGFSEIGGGNQGAHSLGNYGKKGAMGMGPYNFGSFGPPGF